MLRPPPRRARPRRARRLRRPPPPAAGDHLGALRRGRRCRRASRARTATSPRTSSTSPSSSRAARSSTTCCATRRPVRVYLRSPALDAYRPDLEALLARLRAEAGIDIAETGDPAAAQIFIEAVPAAQIARVFPTAACFIVPGETRLARLHAPPARGAAALARPGDARARRDLPAARHHAAGRARLPERGDHPGARPGRRPLPAARLDLERRQLPRHGDALRHD